MEQSDVSNGSTTQGHTPAPAANDSDGDRKKFEEPGEDSGALSDLPVKMLARTSGCYLFETTSLDLR